MTYQQLQEQHAKGMLRHSVRSARHCLRQISRSESEYQALLRHYGIPEK